MNPLLLLLLAGGGYYWWKQQGSPPWSKIWSSIDAASTHVVSTSSDMMHTNVEAGSPAPTVAPLPNTAPVTAATPSVDAPVSTEATATEAPLMLRLVQPTSQPKVPSIDNEQSARTAAPVLDAALVANADGASYTTKNPALMAQVKQFQQVLGLSVDGLYGPQTAGALMYFTGHGPPPPLFYTGERTIDAYLPTP